MLFTDRYKSLIVVLVSNSLNLQSVSKQKHPCIYCINYVQKHPEVCHLKTSSSPKQQTGHSGDKPFDEGDGRFFTKFIYLISVVMRYVL